jgi:crossover junction endodeoxyribonuclease RuvC
VPHQRLPARRSHGGARPLSDRILGVDPGTRVVGYGLVDCDGSRVTYVECGVLRLDESEPMPRRLLTLATGLADILREHRPHVVALEAAFHGVNASSALKLGQARGAVMAVAAERGLEVAEYPPAYVKRAVVGHGRATKEDVMARVQLLFGLARAPTADAADALAIALCHVHAPKLPRRTGP